MEKELVIDMPIAIDENVFINFQIITDNRIDCYYNAMWHIEEDCDSVMSIYDDCWELSQCLFEKKNKDICKLKDIDKFEDFMIQCIEEFAKTIK